MQWLCIDDEGDGLKAGWIREGVIREMCKAVGVCIEKEALLICIVIFNIRAPVRI